MTYFPVTSRLLVLLTLTGTAPAVARPEPPVSIALPRNSIATCEQTLTGIKADLAKQGYFIP